MVGGGKALGNHDVGGRARIGQAASAQIEHVQRLLPDIGKRHQLGGGRLRHAVDTGQRNLDDARLDGGNAIEGSDLGQQRLGGTRDVGENVGETVVLIVVGARLLQRIMGAHGNNKGRDACRHHQGDGERLGPQPPQVTQQFDVERAHRYQLIAEAGLRA